jgi:hypothetical protein
MIITTNMNPNELRNLFSKLSSYVEAWSGLLVNQFNINIGNLNSVLDVFKEKKIKANLVQGTEAPIIDIDGVDVVFAVTRSSYLEHMRLFLDNMSKEIGMLREALMLISKVITPPPSILYVNGSYGLLVIGRSANFHFAPGSALPEKLAEPKPLPQPAGLDPAERARVIKVIDNVISRITPISVKQVVVVDEGKQ